MAWFSHKFFCIRCFLTNPSVKKNIIFIQFRVYSFYEETNEVFTGEDAEVDFTKPENLVQFKEVQMILLHGTDDLNAPYDIMKKFTDELERVAENLTVHFTEGIGHVGLIDTWFDILLDDFKVRNRRLDQ